MENPEIFLLIETLVKSYDGDDELDKEYIEAISVSKGFNVSRKEISMIFDLFKKIESIVPNIKNKNELVKRLKDLNIDTSFVPIILKLINKFKRKEQKKKEQKKKEKKDYLLEQLLMEGIKADRNIINGNILDFEKILNKEKSDMKWSELSDILGLPQIYRFWVLEGDHRNTGIWPGRVLWTKNGGKSYGILWADGYYTEEPLDENIFWVSKPAEEVTFHIEGNEYIPKKLLEEIITIYGNSPDNVIELYQKLIHSPPKDRILTGNMRIKYQSRLLKGLLESQTNKFRKEMHAHFRNNESFQFNVDGSEVDLKFKRIKGDGRCMYRSAASGLNLLCNGDNDEEGNINWKTGNKKETAIAELIMLCSILAIESNIDKERFTMERFGEEGDDMGHTYGDIINRDRPQNYIQKMLMIKSTEGLSSEFWGDDTELNAFVNFVLPELRIVIFNELYREQLLNGLVLDSNNTVNPPTIYLLFTGNHFNALYKDNTKGNLNITRAELVSRLINYVYLRMKSAGRIDLFKKKLKFVLESFSEEEATEIMGIWSSNYSEDADEFDYIFNIMETLPELKEEPLTKKQKKGGGKNRSK